MCLDFILNPLLWRMWRIFFFFWGEGVFFFSMIVIIFAGIHFCSGAMYFCGDLSICWGSFFSVLFCSFIQLVLVVHLFLLCTIWKNYFLLLLLLFACRASVYYALYCCYVLTQGRPSAPIFGFFSFFLFWWEFFRVFLYLFLSKMSCLPRLLQF